MIDPSKASVLHVKDAGNHSKVHIRVELNAIVAYDQDATTNFDVKERVTREAWRKIMVLAYDEVETQAIELERLFRDYRRAAWNGDTMQAELQSGDILRKISKLANITKA